MLNKIQKKTIIRCVIALGGAAVFIIICGIFFYLTGSGRNDGEGGSEADQSKVTVEPHRIPKIDLDVELLTPNRYSRPQLELKQVNAVVVHYTSNPGTDAMDNRNYFNNLPQSNKDRETPRFASAHFIIGLSGDIVQCIPLSEMAYASNDRNSDTVAIECCHPGKNGKFSDETYDSLMELLAYLCIRYELDPSTDIIRHYDVTGKLCPKYYVNHEDAWKRLVSDAVESTEKIAAGLGKKGAEYDLADQDGKIVEESDEAK